MLHKPKNKPKKYVNSRNLQTRYNRSDRTIDRWVVVGILPKPFYIRGQKYWDEAEIDARDAARASEAVS
jgi:hypothetical protein